MRKLTLPDLAEEIKGHSSSPMCLFLLRVLIIWGLQFGDLGVRVMAYSSPWTPDPILHTVSAQRPTLNPSSSPAQASGSRTVSIRDSAVRSRQPRDTARYRCFGV